MINNSRVNSLYAFDTAIFIFFILLCVADNVQATPHHQGEHTTTINNAIVPVALSEDDPLKMNIVLTSNDIINITKATDDVGANYVRIGVGRVCIGSNDSTGMPTELIVTKLVADDVNSTSSADLLLAAYSADSYLDVSVDDACSVVFASSEAEGDFPNTFHVFGRNGVENPSGGFVQGSGFSWANIDKSCFSSFQDTSVSSYVKLRHVGITHSESVSYSTDFENGASQANGFENVNLEGCNSTVTLVLSIKANDILSLLPGGYTTTITMDAQAEVV